MKTLRQPPGSLPGGFPGLSAQHTTRLRPSLSACLAALALLGAALASPTQAQAPSWPHAPVRLVVGFAAGGPTDVIARAFAQYAARGFGQPVMVENRPGANTILAASAVAAAAPDGLTLLAAATNHTAIPALYSDRVKFDAQHAFAPVCTLAISPTVLVTRPDYPARTLAEFLADARAQPGLRTYASPGVGSSGHFAGELFAAQAGLSFTHVPYKGAAPAINDLLGGQVDLSFATLASVLPHIRANTLRALAVAAPARSALLPETPTFAESGAQDWRADAWYGILAPAGTPASALVPLTEKAQAWVAAPQTQETLRAMGLEPDSTCGSEFSAQIARDIETYTALARSLKLSGL